MRSVPPRRGRGRHRGSRGRGAARGRRRVGSRAPAACESSRSQRAAAFRDAGRRRAVVARWKLRLRLKAGHDLAVARVVDGDDVDPIRIVLADRAVDLPAHPPEAVDAHLDRHWRRSFAAVRPPMAKSRCPERTWTSLTGSSCSSGCASVRARPHSGVTVHFYGTGACGSCHQAPDPPQRFNRPLELRPAKCAA